MSDAPSKSEAQCRSAQGKSSTLSLATAPEMLASEVTLGLLAGAEPDTHQFLCHGLINGVIKWVKTQEDKNLTQETGPGMYAVREVLIQLLSVNGIKG
jgi:hypothetical protein